MRCSTSHGRNKAVKRTRLLLDCSLDMTFIVTRCASSQRQEQQQEMDSSAEGALALAIDAHKSQTIAASSQQLDETERKAPETLCRVCVNIL